MQYDASEHKFTLTVVSSMGLGAHRSIIGGQTRTRRRSTNAVTISVWVKVEPQERWQE